MGIHTISGFCSARSEEVLVGSLVGLLYFVGVFFSSIYFFFPCAENQVKGKMIN